MSFQRGLDSSSDKRITSTVAEMTLDSEHRQQSSTTEITWTCSRCIRQLIPRCQLSRCTSSRNRSMDQRHPKSHRFRTCLMFHPKERVKMDQRRPPAEPQAEGTEGRLKELALKWFTDTQAPLILHEGNFPAWFQGFIARKDAEENLRDKQRGCFLIRLSDKAIGYILSYKGRDRCRHFVINQSKSGQFIVSGDTEVHDTLTDLIEYYKRSPIEPFGEYLTYSCFEASAGELYDIIQAGPKDKPAVCVKAARNVWDQLSDRPVEHSKNVPPVPKRGVPLKSGSLDDQSSPRAKGLYAQLEKQRVRGRPTAQPSSLDSLHAVPKGKAEAARTRHQTHQREQITRGTSPAPGPATIYTELNPLDCRSKSLPLLDANSEDEGRSYRLSAPSFTPPRLSPQPPKRAIGRSLPVEQRGPSRGPNNSHSLDHLCTSPVYCLAGQPANQSTPEQSGAMKAACEDDWTYLYAEVPAEPIQSRLLLDNTYEHIPELGLRGGAARPESNHNTYETLEDIKPKHTLSSWGLKNEKWRWLFPEAKRK